MTPRGRGERVEATTLASATVRCSPAPTAAATLPLMRPRPRRRSAVLPALLAPLSLLACKPAPSSPLAPTTSPATAATPRSEPAPSEPVPQPSAIVYGHVRIPSPTAFISALRTGPLLPEAQRSMVDESFLRSMIAMVVPAGSRFSENIDLSRPMGCVVTSYRLHEIPLACVVGYQGGLPKLVEDLGPEGYLNGNDDHAAYRFEGRSVFLVAMGQHVALSFAPDLIAATRLRLQQDLIDAPIGDEELQAVAFPGVILDDTREQLLALVDEIGRAQPPGPAQAAMMDAQRKQWMSWGELDRAELWLDVSLERVRVGYRGTALAGTATEKAYAAARELPSVPAAESLMAQLPASSMMTMGMRMDFGSLLDDPMLGAYTQALATLDGPDAAMATRYRQGFELWRELSTGQAAGALLHERGTKGGLVFTYGLKPGADALPRLREYFAQLSGTADAPGFFTTEVRPAALRVGKARADLVTMSLTPTFTATPGGASFAKLLGEAPRIQIAVVQRGDTLTMAMAPAKVDRYLRRALAAADGKAPLGDLTAAREVLVAQASDTMRFTASLSAIVRWLDQIDAIPPVTLAIPERLDDLVVAMRPAGERQREVTIDVSATMLAALYQLGPTKTP